MFFAFITSNSCQALLSVASTIGIKIRTQTYINTWNYQLTNWGCYQ